MRSIGRYDFLWRTRYAIALVEGAQKSDPDLKFIRKSGGCRPRGRHVGSLGATRAADRQSVEGGNRGDPWRCARVAGVSLAQLCAGCRQRFAASDLCSVPADSSIDRSRHRARRCFLGLDGRSHRPAQSVHRHIYKRRIGSSKSISLQQRVSSELGAEHRMQNRSWRRI